MLVIESLIELVPLTATQQSHVFLGRHGLAGGVFHRGCDNDLDKLALDNVGRGGRVEWSIESDNAAKSGFRVGTECAPVSLVNIIRDGDATGIGVFDDDAGRVVELFYALECRVGIGNIVE